MVLVDTSIWVSHLRAGNKHLEVLLVDGEAVSHPFVVGELACGNIKNRKEILGLIQTLPMTPTIDQEEFLYFVEKNNLMGAGLGFVDVHLLASARISEARIWTSDKRLRVAAVKLDIVYR